MRTEINKKSDFDFIVLDSEGNAINMPSNDFTLDVWTWGSKCRFRASSIGGVLKGCNNDGGKLRVYVDNPGFVPGKLVGEWVSYISSEEYPDGTQRTCRYISDFGIDMVDGDSQINEVQVLAMMQYIQGASAYEIACEYGFDGTEQEWIDSLALPSVQAAKECRQLMAVFSTAETKREENEDARTANEGTRVQQESARVTAEQQRVQAESDRVLAEANRDLNETFRINNEQQRNDNEAARVEREKNRVANENSRVSDEALRVQAETERVDAEAERETAESNRENAEAIRERFHKRLMDAYKEFSRTESQRETAEADRRAAEQVRIANETARQTAEQDRMNAENSRKTAEDARIANESARQTNEQARVAAEANRESAETARQEAEQGRVTAEQQRADAEAARAEEFATFEETLAAKEDAANKVTSIGADADDVHYPSAKAVFDVVLPVNKEEHPSDEEIMQPTATYDNFGIYAADVVYTSSWKAFVFKLNPDKITHFRYSSNSHLGDFYIIMRKVANSGNAETDFAPVSNLMQKMPQYIPSLAKQGKGYITCYGLYDEENPNDDLYLVLNKSYESNVNNVEVATYTTLGSDTVISMKPGNVFDNYEYIKSRACLITGNIFSVEDKIDKVGVVYDTGGLIKYHISYKCVNIKLELGKYYYFGNYKWKENGGTAGANNMAFLIDIKGEGRQLVSSDIKNDSSWRSESGFIITDKSIYIENQRDGNFVIKTPSSDDLLTTFDNLYLCLNVGFNGVSPINDLIINEGTTPKEPSLSIFGYPLSSDNNNEDNPLSGQIVGFFGDSITAGTEGGYVYKVKDKLSLGQAYNYGSSGADTARLVDIITGLNIRGGQYAAIDYNKYAAVTIMIGTNGGVSGNLNNDTPDISIYDINSFPYQYEAEGKTISSATLNEANDFFKLCFPNTFYGNIALCIEYIRWKNPNCQIFLITIPPNNRGNDISVRTGIFNICDKLGVPVIDAQCRAGLARYNLSFFSNDRTHLNVKGNELLASFIANELKRQYYKTDIDNQ